MTKIYKLTLSSCFDGTYGIGFFTTKQKASKIGKRLVKEETKFLESEMGDEEYDKDCYTPKFEIKEIPLDKELDVNDGYHEVL